MDKANIIQKLHGCALAYQDNLAHTNILFLYNTSNRECCEVRFLPDNFLHLTGVTPAQGISSTQFYEKCLDSKLSTRDFELLPRGLTDLKMQVLHHVVQIHNCARMIGHYNGGGIRLQTDVLAGNTSVAVGFKDLGHYYVPNTALNLKTESLQDMVGGRAHKILAVLRKSTKDVAYRECCYCASGFILEDICAELPQALNLRLT